MRKSLRYQYERHPYYEKPLRPERKALHRAFRRASKHNIRKEQT